MGWMESPQSQKQEPDFHDDPGQFRQECCVLWRDRQRTCLIAKENVITLLVAAILVGWKEGVI